MTEGDLHIFLDLRAGDIAQDGVQVIESESYQVAGVVAHQHLVLHRHRHQVVQLVHAVAVQLHDGGVGQLVEHRLQNSPAVYRLVFPEYFLYKPPVEHGGDDVVHHLRIGQSALPVSGNVDNLPCLLGLFQPSELSAGRQ